MTWPSPDDTRPRGHRRRRTRAIAAAFGAAVDTYETDAKLQYQVAERLAARIKAQTLPMAPAILEIGCGTGFLGRALSTRFPDAALLTTDLCEPMVRRCRQTLGPKARALVMDGEHPCLAEGGTFDLITSSLALQWFAEPVAALAGWRRLLRPGGVIAFATLSAGSFAEWLDAHAALGLSAGTPTYPSVDELAALWPGGGVGRIETETLVERYPDGQAFLGTLKRIGAQTAVNGHTPLPVGALRQVLRRFAAPIGLNVTYQVAYGRFQADHGEEP